MSKNTGTSELINYFDLGVDGNVGIAGSLDVNTIANATTDTDRFLVSDSGVIKYRTGSQLLSDIGGQAAGSFVTTDTSQSITANKTFTVGFSLGSDGGSNQTSFFRNTSNIFLGNSGSNIFGFNNSNNIYFGKGSNNGGVLQWNNTTLTRYYTLPDADGTLALTSQIPANPVTGTGASGQVAYFTGTSAISSESNLFWDATNDRLGIGVTPSAPLHVVNSSNGFIQRFAGGTSSAITGGIFAEVGRNFASIGTISNHAFNIFTNDADRFSISTNGNCTIGNSPIDAGFKLDVYGTGRFSGVVQINTNTTGLILNRGAVTNFTGIGYLTNAVGQWFVGMRENLSSNNYIIYNENGTDALTISKSNSAATFSSSVTANGGFFTTNASGSSGISVTSSTASGSGSVIRLFKTDASSQVYQTFENDQLYIGIPASNTTLAEIGTKSSVDLRFNTSLTERMRITSGGNLEFLGSATGLAGAYFTNDNSSLKFHSTFGGNTTKDLILQSGGSSGAPQLILKAGGNVLIGTTTDNGARLQVNGFSRFDRGTLQFTLNPSYAGGNVYSQLQSTGDLALATGGDNNRVYITSDGNVLIGTTTDNGARLQVSGAVTAGAAITNVATLHVNNTSSADPTSLSSVPTSNIFGISTSPGGMLAAGIGATGGTYVWLQGRNLGGAGVSYPISLQPLGGNVGIGTASPTAKLEIQNSPVNDWGLSVFGNTTTSQSYGGIIRGGTNSSDIAFQVNNAANSSTYFSVRGDNLISTGTTGAAPYNNSTTGRSMVIEPSGVLGYLVSTRESKANIESISNIDFIKQLNPVQFNYRKKDNESNTFTDELYDNISYGFIADEVEELNKELVFYNEDGTLAGVEYNSMIAILTKAIQEQQEQINKLKNA
jgi:hypothetical protein